MPAQLGNTLSARPSPAATHAQDSEQFGIENWTVDPASSRLLREQESVKLEPKVMDVLVYLAARSGKVVSREELEAVVWAGTVVSYDTLTGAIQKLRKAFGDNPKQPRVIETVPKKGYRLVAAVVPGQEVAAGVQSAGAEIAHTTPATQWRWAVPVAVLIAVLATAGAVFWFNRSATTDTMPTPGAALRSIAVLPFDNLSGDMQQEYFADGITDDLITGLAKNSDLLVIARDSTFVYKDQPLDVRQIADKLGVRYVLHGSVRRVGQQVRINAQLIDASTGSHLWAEQYDGETGGIFTIQDEITQSIVSTLALKVSTGERQDLGTPLTASSRAYDNFLSGRQRFYLYLNKDENRRARELFEKAIDFDPGFALAYAMLAWTHAFDAMNGWSEERDRSLIMARDLATRAITLQEELPVAYFVRGLAYREQGEYVKALVEAEKATEYDPNYANAHVLLATLLYYAGRPQEGLERMQKAMQLNPHHPYNYSFHLGQAYYILRRYEEAIDAFRRGLNSNPSSERLHVWLAAAYAQSGDIDEAQWEVDQVLTVNPDFSLQRMQQSFPFKDPGDLEHFLDGLRKAGLSE